MVAYILQGIALGVAASVQPGSFQSYVISRTLHSGWRPVLPTALAPLISDGPIIVLVLFILSRVPDWLQQFLYLAGGIFVLYLAGEALSAWRHFDTALLENPQSPGQNLLQAVVVNILNPAPYLFWSLVNGPILLAGWKKSPGLGLGFLVAFYVSLVTSYSCIILVFGTARQLGPKITRSLLGISAVALAGFGVYQLWLGLAGFLIR